MGAEQRGDPGGGALAQHLAHDVDGDGVQAREGLVEDEEPGVADEGGGELDALLIAQGQLLDVVPAPFGQAQALGPLLGGALGPGPVRAVEAGEVGQLPADLHLGVQAALLGHVADAAARGGVHRRAVPGHGSAVALKDAHDDAHGGRLAGAVGPHEADELVGAHVEGQGVEGLEAPISFGQMCDLQHEDSWVDGRDVKFP